MIAYGLHFIEIQRKQTLIGEAEKFFIAHLQIDD